MNKKYIVLYYNDFYFKDILFKKLIEYYMENKLFHIVLITHKYINSSILQYNSLNEVFKNLSGTFIIINKCMYIDNLNEFLTLNKNTSLLKNGKVIGKVIINEKEIFTKYNIKCFSFHIKNNQSRYSLTNILKIKTNKQHLKNGVNIIDIDSVYISKNSVIGKNTTIFPNTIILDSIVKENCNIGPFATIKKNSTIGNNVRIGNFVEIKNSYINDSTKIAHHSYVGDTYIDSYVNIGCGVVTCNYNGKEKNKIYIGKRAFIGSNVNLIAPLNIGSDTYIASGSTIYNDLESFDFAIARSYQVNKKGYSKKYPYYLNFYSD